MSRTRLGLSERNKTRAKRMAEYRVIKAQINRHSGSCVIIPDYSDRTQAPGFYVYVLKTSACNKVYVGITVDPKRRFRQHCLVVLKPWKELTKCGRAVKRYGFETFSLVVKAGCNTEEEAVRIEKDWIKRFGAKRTWNSSRGGEYKYKYMEKKLCQDQKKQ